LFNQKTFSPKILFQAKKLADEEARKKADAEKAAALERERLEKVINHPSLLISPSPQEAAKKREQQAEARKLEAAEDAKRKQELIDATKPSPPAAAAIPELKINEAQIVEEPDTSTKLKKKVLKKKKPPRAEPEIDEQTGDVKWKKDVPIEADAGAELSAASGEEVEASKTIEDKSLLTVEGDLSRAKMKVRYFFWKK
jgi:hypothetical protein